MRRCVLVTVCMFVAGAARADLITVSGDVSGNWSVDTVLVTGDLCVPAGHELTIAPGVQVRFEGSFKLLVQGKLTAAGSATDSILFTRNRAVEESRWRGIRFDHADDASVLQYCRIEWAKGSSSSPDVRGGSIWIHDCSPLISHCLLINNYSHNDFYNGTGGGVCLDENSDAIIEYSTIILNQADSGGGICVGAGSHGIIRHNLIEGNYAFHAGGGIYVAAGAESSIYDNVISGNDSDGYGGGGINLWSATWLYGTTSDVYDNLIIHNNAADAGGGIYSRYDASRMRDNTIISNTAQRGAGLYVLTFAELPPIFFNSIVWGNSAPVGSQILLDPSMGSTATITYCNVAGGWSGQGIINQYPEFVDTTLGDYRLAWSSPCIDYGDPTLLYNDPDSTRADIGAGYFDQSVPVRILLTPHASAIQIMQGGGSFDYTLRVTNITATSQSALIWCDVTLPGGQIYGPLLGPVQVVIPDSVTLSRVRTQTVPGGAAAGIYTYNAYAAVGADTSRDAFTFIKQGGGRGGIGAGWSNSGEEFEAGETNSIASVGEKFSPLSRGDREDLAAVSPNPFNPIATIRYQIASAVPVRLTVYDLQGRLVATLVDGIQEAGNHEAIFDGSNLPSGIYVYHLNMGGSAAADKLILLK